MTNLWRYKAPGRLLMDARGSIGKCLEMISLLLLAGGDLGLFGTTELLPLDLDVFLLLAVSSSLLDKSFL